MPISAVRRRLLPAYLLVAAWAASPAFPHAFWPTFYSSKTAISLDENGLRAVVVVEIPTVSLVPKFRQHFAGVDLKKEIQEGRFEDLEARFRDHLFEELGSGLSLEIDGRGTPGRWQPVDTPANGLASEGFFVYMLEFEPDEPLLLDAPGEHRLRVRNDLYPDKNIVLANYVETKEGWQLIESSTPQPPAESDLTVGSPAEIAMWSQEPEMRDFRIVVLRAP